MDRPVLPSVAPGRSALPAFLALEAQLRERAVSEEARAAALVEEAEARAARIRAKGEERLQQVVVEAEAQAKREAEAKARDRISDGRVKTQRWIEAAERAVQATVDQAVDRLIRGDADAR